MIHCSLKFYDNILRNHQHPRTCEFAAQTKNESTIFYDEMKVRMLNKDVWIVFWIERERDVSSRSMKGKLTLKFSTVHWTERCRMSVTKIEIESCLPSAFDNTNILTYGDNFDVIYRDEEKCGNETCRITFDANGMIAGRTVIPLPTYPDGMIKIYQSSGNRLVARVVEQTSNLWLTSGIITLYENGTLEELKARDQEEIAIDVDVKYGHLGWCVIEERQPKQLICSQYDENDNVIFTNYTVQIEQNILGISVLNMPGGGLVVQALSYFNETSFTSFQNSFTVLQSDNNISKSLIKNTEYDCECFNKEQLKKNEEGEYCVYITCQTKKRYTLSIECLPKELIG
ncbi:hypothetical protein QAD02_009339 [Eretmocerus hayati]|uniref:Uncharacterized protein n=1 Tax=Eretmocerus hayati TaxID=131215 RepID=A0ACC2NAG1_9HYME|nr:hypothetical protein QAD02_009339 [Eretmocerus hayati]